MTVGETEREVVAPGLGRVFTSRAEPVTAKVGHEHAVAHIHERGRHATPCAVVREKAVDQDRGSVAGAGLAQMKLHARTRLSRADARRLLDEDFREADVGSGHGLRRLASHDVVDEVDRLRDLGAQRIHVVARDLDFDVGERVALARAMCLPADLEVRPVAGFQRQP